MQFLQTCKVHGSLYVYLSYGSLRKDWLSCPFRGDVRISAICGCGISKFPTGKTWESTNATSQKPESRGFPQLGGGCDRCGDTAVFPRLLSGGEASPSLSRITIDLNFERKLVGLKRKQSPFFTVATLEMFEKTPQLGGLTNPFAKYAPVKLDHFFSRDRGDHHSTTIFSSIFGSKIPTCGLQHNFTHLHRLQKSAPRIHQSKLSWKRGSMLHKI